ncbi:MAG: D-glycero-beta-D-manno-heptose 1-phosphate adenylyltransferase [Longimicrobiales bacterium]
MMADVTDPQTKLFDCDALLERYARPRTQQLVFTNGVFDLLHRGHVQYLYAARGLGDILVVGVNTDASVRRLKGEDRPFMAQADRAFVVAGLGCVDAVTLFDEDTPEQLIARLLPDVLVKGGDYSRETVAGRHAVEASGGRVMILPLVPGRSTTGIVDSIRNT